MLAVLPVLALGLSVLAFKAKVSCWREAILYAAVAWAVVLVAITEGLSAFHYLTAAGLAIAWLIISLVAAARVVTSRPRPGDWWPHGRLDRLHTALLGSLAAAIVVLGAIAVISPPNTWDSMTYHMARLIHWQQNASLAPYPTHIPRQLYLQPGAEFVLLQLQILSGGDRLAGLVQWASMLGVLVGISLLARDLGARHLGTLAATMFAASLPIGVLESTSTQNDYVVALWLVCAMLFGLRVVRLSRPALSSATIVAFGASVGLALLTKATAYLLALPMVIWVVLCVVRRVDYRSMRLIGAAGVLAVLLNTGFLVRNLTVFGLPLGPLDEGAPTLRYVNDGFSPQLLMSNIVRDVGLNVVATPFAAINVRGRNFVQLIHTWLGVNIADPRTTWGEQVFAEQPAGLAFDENFASNPIHLLLLLVSLGALFPLRRALSRVAVSYAMVLTGGFLLFCIVLRWQPWHTRLELPFFVLGAPLVGIVAERIAPQFAGALAVALLVSMLPWVVYNQARPLVGPRSILGTSHDDRYFTNRPGLRAAYLTAVDTLVQRGCARVGFVSTVDGWEYPLWALLDETSLRPLEIEHVDVTNATAGQVTGEPGPFQPCAVLVLGPKAGDPSLVVGSTAFKPSWRQLDEVDPLQQVAVMTPDGS